MTKKVHLLLWAGCLAALWSVIPAAPLAADDDHGMGKYGQMTADWWQWVFRQPASNNPLFDETGAKAGVGQTNPNVFFLVGVANETGTATRTITVPFGKALFGAAINYENDNIFYDPPVGVGQLREDGSALIDAVEGLFLTLDGVSRLDLVSRVKSPVFEYVLPAEDNIYQFFGVDVSGTIRPAVSDGYWFYIPALPRGVHTLHFGAGYPGFAVDISYTITVQ